MTEVIEFLRHYGAALALIGTLATALLSTRFVRREEIAALSTKVEALEDRAARVEGQLEHMPDKDVAHRLEMAVARLEGKLEVVDERLKPLASITARMQDHLLRDK